MNMGYMEKDWSATAFVPNLVDWGIEDPNGKSIEKVREIRDEIEKRVRELTLSILKDVYQ
jgi:arsenate reductase (thioredoxin)